MKRYLNIAIITIAFTALPAVAAPSPSEAIYANEIGEFSLINSEISQFNGTFAGVPEADVEVVSYTDFSIRPTGVDNGNWAIRVQADAGEGTIFLFSLSTPIPVDVGSEVDITVDLIEPDNTGSAGIYVGVIRAAENAAGEVELIPGMTMEQTNMLQSRESIALQHSCRTEYIVPFVQIVGPAVVYIDRLEVVLAESAELTPVPTATPVPPTPTPTSTSVPPTATPTPTVTSTPTPEPPPPISALVVYTDDRSSRADDIVAFCIEKGIIAEAVSDDNLLDTDIGSYDLVVLASEYASWPAWNNSVEKYNFLLDSSKPLMAIAREGAVVFRLMENQLDVQLTDLDDGHGNQDGPGTVETTLSDHPVYNYPNVTGLTRLQEVTVVEPGGPETSNFRITSDSHDTDFIKIGGMLELFLVSTSIAEQRNFFLWGYGASPQYLTEVGAQMFENALYYVATLDDE